MSTEVEFISASPVFQGVLGPVTWEWANGDRDNYTGFSVRPYTANIRVAVVRMFVDADNSLNQLTKFAVTITAIPSGGARGSNAGELRFTAIRAPA